MKKENYKYFIHNFFGHPIMAILNIFGFNSLANKIHDYTLPKKEIK